MDGVQTRVAGARVAASRAARGGAALGRSIGDPIARTRATALESVVQTEPVTSLVDGSLAEVEALGRTSRHGGGQDGAAVADEGVRALGGVGGEVAVSQVAAEVVLEVDVEVRVGALAELRLHLHLAVVVGPGGVDGLGGAGKGHGDAVGSEVGSQDIELLLKSGVLDLISFTYFTEMSETRGLTERTVLSLAATECR